MKMSPKEVNSFRNSFTFSASALTFFPSESFALPSSSMWKRRFSSRMTCPSLALATVSETSFPTQSLRKVTFFPSSSFSSSGTTGARLYLSLRLPSGRPRWDMRITALAPWSMAYLMEGTAPTIRWLLVTCLEASRGTLKSTLRLRHLSKVLFMKKVGNEYILGSRHACL